MFSKILSTGSYVPKHVQTNHDLTQYVDTSDAWIQERTGICQRHVARGEETIAFMSTQAAQKALESAQIPADDLDMIIVATTSAEHSFPSAACLVLKNLTKKHMPAFDISAACSGFMYAMSVADQFIKTGAAQRIMVIGADKLSHLCDPTDRSTLILFGDAASAVILSASTEPGILSTHVSGDGAKFDLLKCTSRPRSHELEERTGYIEMKGNEVFRIAVSNLAKMVQESLAEHDMKPEDLDWLIPHQANLRIIKATAKKLNMGLDKVVVNVDRYGNTSAASVPLALDEAVRYGRIQRGQNILLEAFGGGFVWGSALIKY